MVEARKPLRNRGTAENPANRFVPITYDPDPEFQQSEYEKSGELESPSPRTQFLRDTSRSIISYNDSPDVNFDASVNPYRGCEHGCIYCYARPTHEYFGFSAGLDFETKILVKEDAPKLLRKELSSPKWTPQVLALSGVTDPYQPIEGKLRLTRGCLEVLREFQNPVGIITKNHLVKRDVDLLAPLAEMHAAAVSISITTLNNELHKVLEPRTCQPLRRLEAIRALHQAGVPVGVLIGPVIPALTDHELPAIIEAAADAGATHASFIMLRLPGAVAPLFEQWLEDHFPDRKEKVLNRVRDMRNGALNAPGFGRRMRGTGVFAEQTAALFQVACRKAGLNRERRSLSSKHFRRPGGRQLEFFADE